MKNDHLCNNCHYAATNTCNANEMDYEMVRSFDNKGMPIEEVISCRHFKKDTTFDIFEPEPKSNLRSIKEINILIDQMMIEAGLDTVVSKVGYLQVLQHDYIQDIRDENE